VTAGTANNDSNADTERLSLWLAFRKLSALAGNIKSLSIHNLGMARGLSGGSHKRRERGTNCLERRILGTRTHEWGKRRNL